MWIPVKCGFNGHQWLEVLTSRNPRTHTLNNTSTAAQSVAIGHTDGGRSHRWIGHELPVLHREFTSVLPVTVTRVRSGRVAVLVSWRISLYRNAMSLQGAAVSREQYRVTLCSPGLSRVFSVPGRLHPDIFPHPRVLNTPSLRRERKVKASTVFPFDNRGS